MSNDAIEESPTSIGIDFVADLSCSISLKIMKKRRRKNLIYQNLQKETNQSKQIVILVHN